MPVCQLRYVLSLDSGEGHKTLYERSGRKNSLVLGDGKPPTFNDGNPYNGAL